MKRSPESASGRAVLKDRMEGVWFEKTKRLAAYLDHEAEALRAAGFPIGSGMRIDPEQYQGIPEFASRREQDQRYVDGLEAQFYPGMNADQRREKRLWSYSEMFELLKTAVMHRGIGDRFVVARSAHFDDIRNGVDNVIVDRTTGSIVGALDEVGETEGDAISGKKLDIERKNKAGGIKIQYAFRVARDDRGTSSVVLESAENVPVFLLYLNQERIHKGLDKIDTNVAQPSDFEQELLKAFFAVLDDQVKKIERYENYSRLNQKMRANLANLKAYIKSRKAS